MHKDFAEIVFAYIFSKITKWGQQDSNQIVNFYFIHKELAHS